MVLGEFFKVTKITKKNNRKTLPSHQHPENSSETCLKLPDGILTKFWQKSKVPFLYGPSPNYRVKNNEKVLNCHSLLVLFILTTLTSPKAPRPMTLMTSKSDRRILSSAARWTKGPVHSKNSDTCFSLFRFEFSSSFCISSKASSSVSYEKPLFKTLKILTQTIKSKQQKWHHYSKNRNLWRHNRAII